PRQLGVTRAFLDTTSALGARSLFRREELPMPPKTLDANAASHTIDDAALDVLFREARTYMAWQSRPVTDDTLHSLYDLLKWAPTSANSSPARFAFLRSKEA